MSAFSRSLGQALYPTVGQALACRSLTHDHPATDLLHHPNQTAVRRRCEGRQRMSAFFRTLGQALYPTVGQALACRSLTHDHPAAALPSSTIRTKPLYAAVAKAHIP